MASIWTHLVPFWYALLSLIVDPIDASSLPSLVPLPRRLKWSPVSMDSPLIQGPYEVPGSIALDSITGDQLIRRAFIRTIKNIWSDHRVQLDRDFDLEDSPYGYNASEDLSSELYEPSHAHSTLDLSQPVATSVKTAAHSHAILHDKLQPNAQQQTPLRHRNRTLLQNPLTALTTIVVDIAVPDVDLQEGVDESYSLRLPYMGDKVLIEAATVWGAIRALSTFEQMVDFDKAKDTFVISKPVVIADAPIYLHRGIMIDTSRNFYSVESLLRQIDAMSMAKLNVFHWHLSDSQSWPLMVQSYPNMTRDAYSLDETYSPADVRSIVGYAWERGVRVIPEIDVPGHSNAGWKQIDPSIVVCADSNWEHSAVEPVPGQLNPLNNNTYKVLANVYKDVSSYFPDELFHVGFDELNAGCYNSDPMIQDWLKSSNRTYKDLAAVWVNTSIPIFHHQAVPQKRRLMMWEDSVLSETFGIDIPQDVVMQSWGQGLHNVKKLIDKGYDVVISSHDFFYLDCGYGNWVFNDTEVLDQNDPSPGTRSYNYGGDGGSWCGPYKSWQRIYNFDFMHTLTPHQQSHVLGAELALWSEQSDSHSVDNKVWPRAAAFAELLWSGNRDTDGNLRTLDLAPRLMKFRDTLVRRGLDPTTVAPKYCMAHPEKCAFT